MHTGRRLALLFPGQGTQHPGMGADLARRSAAARRVFEEVDEALGRPLSALMWDQGAAAALQQTENAQPAIFAHSLAAWAAWAAQEEEESAPAVALGHSVGEYAALAAAGALPVADGARLLRLRGAAMQRAADAAPGGHAMVALMPAPRAGVEAAVAAAAEATGEVVGVAAVNSARQMAISGSPAAVEEAVRLAKEQHGVRRATPLRVSAPFHCELLRPAADELREALAAVPWGPLAFPVVSNVTAAPVADAQAWPALLERQVVAPVDWVGCMAAAEALADRFAEFGPGEVLAGLATVEVESHS